MSKNDQWGPGDTSNIKPFNQVMMGDETLDLFFGEHPHSRSDNNIYAKLPNGSIYEFSGHRVLINVDIESRNYMKSSGLSGDEITKSVSGKIYADGDCIYTVPGRDVIYVMNRIIGLITELSEHPSGVMSKQERNALKGRKIYYDCTPAIIESFQEGELSIRVAQKNAFFPPPMYVLENEDYALENEYAEDSDSNIDYVEVDVLSPKIWWFRDKLVESEMSKLSTPIPPLHIVKSFDE